VSRSIPMYWMVAALFLGGTMPLRGQLFPPQPPPEAPPERPQRAGTIPFGGTEYFRFLLYMQKLSPVRDLEEIEQAPPSQSMVILLGYTGHLPLGINGTWLDNYVRNGGAVLIATDQSTDRLPGESTWSKVFGIHLTGMPLVANAKDCYEGVERRIFVKRATTLFKKPDPAFAIFDNIEATGEKGLATDMPTEMAIRGTPDDFSATWLARYPDSTRRADRQSTLPYASSLFAISLRPRSDNGGRLIVLADHGVFVNGMMGIARNESGNGVSFNNANFRFAKQLSSWLQAGGSEPRNKCLFIENGQIRDTFAREVPNVPPKNPKQPPPEMIANVLLGNANALFREAENQNVFNRTLLGSEESYAGYVRSFIYLVTGLMLFLALRLFWKAYWKVDKPASESANTLNESLPREGVVVQQKSNQLLLGNLYDAMRIRIRDRFDRMGGQPNSDGEMPPLLIADYQDKAASIRRNVTTIWQIGYGGTPIFIDASDWDPLNQDLERLMNQAVKGYWSFGQEI
jgi:hypothetical protein